MSAREPAHLVVACVVERDGRFLMVEESIGGDTLFNQPAGHWEPGERFTEGACRETLEETGWEVEVQELIGVYEHQPEHLPYPFVRLAFVARALRHHPEQPLDTGILRALWMSREDLLASQDRHRSPMVMRCVDDYLAGQRLPLTALTHL